MDQTKLLLEIEEAFGRLSDGLNAVELMALGLEDVQDPYADGLYAICRYLGGVQDEMKQLLKAVSSEKASA